MGDLDACFEQVNPKQILKISQVSADIVFEGSFNFTRSVSTMTIADAMSLLKPASKPQAKSLQEKLTAKAEILIAEAAAAQSALANAAASKTAPSAVYESAASTQQQQMQGWLQNLEKDKDLIEATRIAFGLTNEDNVQIFVVPKGQNRIQLGSVITRPTTSPRAEQLTRLVSSTTARLREVEIGTYSKELTDDERARMMGSLRSEINRNQRALSRERARIATLPRSGWIIVER